ncbi:hypothetical protein ABFB09_01095 [Dehalogenimonas sp. THU2]|uniref:hypothetical protein n=1 Tax=Dehalogenimonas sp. THU2 TaxID=3151121 RepID=UPI0032188E39
MSEQQGKRKSASGVLIPAGLFIGMGIGFAVDELVAGMFIGLGVGFLLMVLVQMFIRD